MKIESYGIDKSNLMGKQHCLYFTSGNAIYPAIFLQRPKWITNDEAWEKLVSSISLNLPAMDTEEFKK